MPANSTAFNSKVARPYAKAVFAFALANKKLDAWSLLLTELAAIAADDKIQKFVNNPDVTAAQITELFSELTTDNSSDYSKNLIELLASNKKIMLLPEIARQYAILLATEKQELAAEIISAFPLSDQQKQRLQGVLETRFKNKIILDCKTDQNLLGGLMVRINDQIIDGSVLGRIERLRTKL